MRVQKISGVLLTGCMIYLILDSVRIAVITDWSLQYTASLIYAVFCLLCSVLYLFQTEIKKLFLIHCISDFLSAGYSCYLMLSAHHLSQSLNGKPDTALPGLNAVGSVMLVFSSVMYCMIAILYIFMGILGLTAVRKNKNFTACMMLSVILILIQIYLRFSFENLLCTGIYFLLALILKQQAESEKENAP